MKNIQLFLDVFVLVLLVLIHLLIQAREEFVMSRCHTRGSIVDIVGARSHFLTFSFIFARFARFGRFACFGGFGGFVSLVSLVSVVSFRPFRFVVSGFCTCRAEVIFRVK